ncbi:MAG: hypothetical protein HY925_13150 [Elusimicrobia bacterium]|nr:hypothetical protein [Elusimicrobiota bacterium]
MTRPATLLLVLAFAIPSSAIAAQGIVVPIASDVYFLASPDPLAQSVLRSQLGSRSGGSVSAVLRKNAAAPTAAASVEVEGAPVSAGSLELPAAAIPRGASAVGADGAQNTPLPPKALTSRFLKRSIAASQLLSVVEAMRSKAHAQRVSKGTP